jgi:hypothetical protein
MYAFLFLWGLKVSAGLTFMCYIVFPSHGSFFCLLTPSVYAYKADLFENIWI